MTEESIFHAALDRADPDERAVYLDEACGDDVDLRRRVAALIRAHEGAGDFLEPMPAVDPARGNDVAGDAPTVPGPDALPGSPSPEPTRAEPAGPTPVAEGPGSLIGPYKLLQKLGEGGMGVVYLAVQERPIRRKVALKIIKPGMDTEQVVARFEAERQALALMDHPHIARVLDAGATASGRPYFVMELVKGVAITAYCDAVHLTPRERLELFLPVCQAIQHAHQKGVIHRDIKPSNVLVALQDGKPVPKVIDFGVAKAIQQRLTERSVFTQIGAIVGTIEYMSPEQAELSALDVDTRTDVYALGVLLYELLTGTTPLERERLRQAGYAELLRRIREEEPPKPSTRLSDSREALPSVAALRKTEPAKLTRLVRGDLDWIVMKALEKDRTRRYESADGLARDVRRHLEGDPVEAGPPSRAYRLRKVARKHRAALATAAAFALVLVGATAVSSWEAWRATRSEALAEARLSETRKAQATTQEALKQSEEARKQAEAVSTFLTEAFRSPDPSQGGRELKVADVLDRAVGTLDKGFTGSPATKGALLDALGRTYVGLGLYEKAIAVHEKGRALREAALGPDHPDTLASRSRLAGAYISAGRNAEAIALLEANLKLQEAKLGADHDATGYTRNNLAHAYVATGRTTDAVMLFETNLKLQEMKLGPDHPDMLATRNNLATAYHDAGRDVEANALLEAILKTEETKLGADHPSTLISRMNLAVNQSTAQARIPRLESTVRLMEGSKLGPGHPTTVQCLVHLARAYRDVGDLGKAESVCRVALTRARKSLSLNDPPAFRALTTLGWVLLDEKKWPEAEQVFRECLDVRQKYQPNAWATFDTRSLLGEALLGQGRFAEAEPLIVSGFEGMNRLEATIPKPSKAQFANASRRVIRLYEAWGKPDQAKSWKAKLGLDDLPAEIIAPPPVR
jgi:serine/threonine protein kinase/tetratricopeptide (TPR) repeat protein